MHKHDPTCCVNMQIVVTSLPSGVIHKVHGDIENDVASQSKIGGLVD